MIDVVKIRCRPTLALPSVLPSVLVVLGLFAAAPGHSAPGEAFSPIPSFDTGGLEARSAALILSGQRGGELKASTLAVPLEGTDAEVRLALIIDIEGSSLLEGQPPEEDLITEIYAYALDEAGGVGGFLTQAFRLDLEEYRPLLQRQGVKFLGALKLPPGFYTLQVLIRQRRSDRFNLQSLALAVEKPDKTNSELLLPLFPEPPEPWIVVGQAPAEGESTLAGLPWDLGTVPALPATFPVLRNDRATSLFLMGEAAGEDSLVARLKDTSGAVVTSLDLELGESKPGPGGRSMRSVRLSPTRQVPGQYFLEIERPEVPPMEGQGTKVGGKPAVIAGIGIAVLPGAVGDPLPTWAQLLSPAEPEEAQAPSEGVTVASRNRRVGLDRWWRAYRKALLLTDEEEDPRASTEELLELETSQLSTGRDRRSTEVRAEQVAAILELARANPESLVPLIRFHEQQYQYHHGNRHFLLATHSRQLSVRLAEAYLELADTEGARRIAAANLVSLAGYLQKVGSGPSARRAFEKALEYEPENEAALLGLGALLEGNEGDYAGAERAFRKLVELRPRNSEARLRLAVNLRRLGRSGEAEELFRELLKPPAARWVRTGRLRRAGGSAGRVQEGTGGGRDAPGGHPRASGPAASPHPAGGCLRSVGQAFGGPEGFRESRSSGGPGARFPPLHLLAPAHLGHRRRPPLPGRERGEPVAGPRGKPHGGDRESFWRQRQCRKIAPLLSAGPHPADSSGWLCWRWCWDPSGVSPEAVRKRST